MPEMSSAENKNKYVALFGYLHGYLKIMLIRGIFITPLEKTIQEICVVQPPSKL